MQKRKKEISDMTASVTERTRGLQVTEDSSCTNIQKLSLIKLIIRIIIIIIN